MKIIVIENLFGEGAPYISLRPDTAILRNNDDFYMPFDSADVRCGVGVVLRITRLAKCLDARFASRCYDDVGVGVAFVECDLLARLRSEGLPAEAAYCFDRSLAISTEAVAKGEIVEGVVEFSLANELKQTISLAALKESLDECIARASRLLTLKTGDVVFVQMPADVKVEAEQSVVVNFDGRELINFQIK